MKTKYVFLKKFTISKEISCVINQVFEKIIMLN